MFRGIRASLSALVFLAASACVGAPAGAPVPDDASEAEIRAAAMQDQCRRARNQMDCYSESLLTTLEGEGVGQAMETLEELAARDESVERDGHMYAHAIGLSAAPSPAEVGETFRACRPSFQSGCYHGVIQSYFADLTAAGGDIGAESVNDLCGDYRGEADRWLLFQCVHGIGHGLTMLEGYHLPSALEGCDLLADEWDREGCYGGVFMESIVNATTPHHAIGRPDAEAGAAMHGHGAAHGADAGAAQPAMHHGGEVAGAGHDEHAGHGAAPAAAMPREPFPALDRTDALYPCSVLEDRYLVACYQMQTSAILFHNGGNLRAAAAACDEAPEQYRGYCYLSLGRDVSAITLQDHEKARSACTVGDEEYNVWCHIGYVKNLVDLTADPLNALSYCRGVGGEEIKQACYHAVGEEIWVLTNQREQGEEWCEMAESGHRESCRRGAGLASWRDAEAGAE